MLSQSSVRPVRRTSTQFKRYVFGTTGAPPVPWKALHREADHLLLPLHLAISVLPSRSNDTLVLSEPGFPSSLDSVTDFMRTGARPALEAAAATSSAVTDRDLALSISDPSVPAVPPTANTLTFRPRAAVQAEELLLSAIDAGIDSGDISPINPSLAPPTAGGTAVGSVVAPVSLVDESFQFTLRQVTDVPTPEDLYAVFLSIRAAICCLGYDAVTIAAVMELILSHHSVGGEAFPGPVEARFPLLPVDDIASSMPAIVAERKTNLRRQIQTMIKLGMFAAEQPEPTVADDPAAAEAAVARVKPGIAALSDYAHLYSTPYGYALLSEERLIQLVADPLLHDTECTNGTFRFPAAEVVAWTEKRLQLYLGFWRQRREADAAVAAHADAERRATRAERGRGDSGSAKAGKKRRKTSSQAAAATRLGDDADDYVD
jgi:hypothetical protein